MTRHCAFAGIYCLEIIPGAQSGLAIIQQSVPVEVRNRRRAALTIPSVCSVRKRAAHSKRKPVNKKQIVSDQREKTKEEEREACRND